MVPCQKHTLATIQLRKYNKRIGLYASSSANRGGTGVYTKRLIAGFQKAGITEVTALGTGNCGAVAKLVSEHISIPRMVNKTGFDLLHLPAFGGRAVSGVPYAVTVHDMAFMARPDWFPLIRSIYYRFHFPWVARNASVIIADSDFTVSEIRKYLGLEAHRVYLSAPQNTVDESVFRRAFNIRGDYILSTGTVEPRKNIDSLLAAWPLIKKTHPELTMVVAGRWGWGKKRTKLALSCTPGVRWVGSVPDNMLMSAFSGARLLVYPSLYEGFGLPPLEAAASGVPFVIGPSETLYEIFGSVSAGISGESPLSISQAVLDALEKRADPRSLRKFAEQFTDVKMAVDTYMTYGKAFQ